MQKSVWKKRLVIGMVILFLGVSVLPTIVSRESWRSAYIQCQISGLEYNDVSWFFGFPRLADTKKLVFCFNLESSIGDGYIEITPHGQSRILYYYPEDFHRLNIVFIYAPVSGIKFYPIFFGYLLQIDGTGYVATII